MDKIAIGSQESRSRLFTQTGEKIGIDTHLAEKDFWVCWTLKRLFSVPELNEHLIFKGGTTLSKVYGIINRFSEDIDLTLDRTFFGFRDDPEKTASRKRRDAIIDDMMAECSRYVCNELLKLIHHHFSAVLGKSRSDFKWDMTICPIDKDRQTLLFQYPAIGVHSDYNPPAVRLEFGSKSDLWPTEKASVISYAAEQFPDAFDESRFNVTALNAERTFWEKATILHQVAHWPEDRPLLPRYSRHYYDLAMLSESSFLKSALKDMGLLARVIEHKNMYFRCGWANYETAKPGTFELISSDKVVDELRSDYVRMEPMIFGHIPSFDDILGMLHALEVKINSTTQNTA